MLKLLYIHAPCFRLHGTRIHAVVIITCVSEIMLGHELHLFKSWSNCIFHVECVWVCRYSDRFPFFTLLLLLGVLLSPLFIYYCLAIARGVLMYQNPLHKISCCSSVHGKFFEKKKKKIYLKLYTHFGKSYVW